MGLADDVDSFSETLSRLRTELISLREQDIKLLKQLIQIQESIRKLADNNNLQKRYRRKSDICRTHSLSVAGTWRCPLLRQQSEPHFYKVPRAESLDNIGENLEWMDESSLESGSDLGDSTSSLSSLKDSCLCSRPRSFSLSPSLVFAKEKKTDDSNYEEILKTNISIWKASLRTEMPKTKSCDVIFECE